jgi:aspartokinase
MWLTFKKTEKAIADTVAHLVKSGFVITQGFVGSSPEGFAVTLGREKALTTRPLSLPTL